MPSQKIQNKNALVIILKTILMKFLKKTWKGIKSIISMKSNNHDIPTSIIYGQSIAERISSASSLKSRKNNGETNAQ